MKTCNRCKIEKPVNEYYLDRGVPRGICKDCFKLARKQYAITHKEQTAKAGKRYRQSLNGITKRRAWERKRAKTQRFIEYQKKWAITEKGKAARRGRVNRFAKTEKGFAANKRRHARRRSNLKNIIADLTAAEWKEILKKFDNKCVYCGISFSKQIPPTQDHKIPISKGGHHTKDNILPACKPCNSRKCDKII